MLVGPNWNSALLLRSCDAIKLRLFNDRGPRFTGQFGPRAGREHRSSGWLCRRELSETQGNWHIVVNRFHATAHEISLVPKTRATR
jgi:hypothetical protein